MNSFSFSPSLVGVFSFETVSGWPVWSSCFSASGGQTLGADWLAIFLLSVSAGWEVVLDKCFSSPLHFFRFNAVSSVESIADLDWLSSVISLHHTGWSAFLSWSSVFTIADWQFPCGFNSKGSFGWDVFNGIGFNTSSSVESIADLNGVWFFLSKTLGVWSGQWVSHVVWFEAVVSVGKAVANTNNFTGLITSFLSKGFGVWSGQWVSHVVWFEAVVGVGKSIANLDDFTSLVSSYLTETLLNWKVLNLIGFNTSSGVESIADLNGVWFILLERFNLLKSNSLFIMLSIWS